tara:strand:- start:249 stop:713 length:465 start_codon:yes stop_codon:yes gene_type:complete
MIQKMIKDLVEDYYKIKIDTVTRKREYVEARAIYFKLLRDNSRMSTSAIGKTMNKDHATVLHFNRKIKDWFLFDKQLKQDYDTLNDRVQHATELNPELFKDSLSLEGFYEIEYKKLKAKNKKEYNALVNKYNFLKSRLERYEPKRILRGEFDLV